jgi:acyl-CoA thioesterase-1
MNRFFRAFTGGGSLRHEVQSTYAGRSSAPQGRTWTIERPDGEPVRPIQWEALEGLRGEEQSAQHQRADVVLRPRSERTERRGYRANPRAHAAGWRYDRSVSDLGRVGLVAALTACLAACGGGGGGDGSSSPSPTANPAPSIAATGPIQPTLTTGLVEEYGDSTTAGATTTNGVALYTTNSDPADEQKLLQSAFGASVTVGNQGVGGTEASQLLNGTDGLHPTWANQMASSKAKIVTINFGLNDAYYSSVVTTGIPQETLAEYAATMTQLVQIARSYGKQVVLFEPNPTCDPVREPLMPSFVAALESVSTAQGVPIAKDYAAILALPNWQSMLPDCLHPNEALYEFKAQQEEAVIGPLVKAAMATP